jgi:hypothetical protein
MSNLATITNNILADSGIDDINVIVSTGSYANPAWITSLAWTKITGAPSGIVTGSGTTNYLPKFTGTSTIGNSIVFDNGTNVGINTSSPGERFTVNGYVGLQRSGTQIWHYGVDSTNSLEFVRSGIATRMILSSDGNLGLGVTPSAWNSAYKAMQFGTTGAIFGESGDAANYFTTNTFVDAVGFKYITSDWAIGYFQENGVHSWRTAPSGTAGNAISFTQAMTLNASGKFSLGTAATHGNATFEQTTGESGIVVNSSIAESPTIYLRDAGGAGYSTILANNNLYLNASRILVGTTTDNGARLQVSGNGNFYSNSSIAGNANGIRIEQAGSGDSAISFLLTGVREWLVGIDNSDSDTFKINNNTGGSDFNNVGLAITTTGAATFSSSVTVGTDVTLNSGTLFVSAGSGQAYSSRLLTAYIFPYITTYLDSFAGPSWEGRLQFRTNSSNGAMNTQLTILNSGAATFSGLAGSGNRVVVANSGGTLISAVIGSGLAFDGTTLTATGGGSGSISGSGTSGTVALFTGATSIGNSVITQSGSTIGITSGITDSVVTFTNSTAYSTSNTYSLTYRSTTASFGIQPIANIIFDTVGDAASRIRFVTRANAADYDTRMTITAGGNVGIGTLNPGGKLGIQVANSGSNVSGLDVTNATNASFNVSLRTDFTTITAGGTGNLVFANASERLRVHSSGTIAFSNNGGVGNAGTDTMSMGHFSSNYGWIQTWAGTPLLLNPSGNPVIIGSTSNNGARFQVSGTATFSSNVAAGSTSSGAQINVFASSYGNNGLFNAYGTDNFIKLQMGALGTNEGFIFTGSGNKISFFSGGNLALTLNSNQTATFSSSVTANTLLTVNTPASGSGVIFRHVSGTNNPGLFIETVESSRNVRLTASGSLVSGQLLQLGAEGNAGVLNIGGSNVGIGTPSPTHKLQVLGSSDSGIRLTDSSGNTRALLNPSGVQHGEFTLFNNSGNATTYLGGGGGSNYVMAQGGNFLIGTTTDNGAKLNVNGTVFIGNLASGTNAILDFATNASGGPRSIIYRAATAFLDFTNTAGSAVFQLSNGGAATFSSSVTATSFFESSDATLKTLITDNYQAKGIDSVVAKLYIKNGKEELGYFAQDLQDVLPSAVSKGSDGLLNLSYREVHTAKIAYLEERIKQLEKKYENN